MIVKISGVPVGNEVQQVSEPVNSLPVIPKNDLAFLSGMAFTFNDPTVMAITFSVIGFGAVIAEVVLRDTKYGPFAEEFLQKYVKYGYPVAIVGIGVWAFVKCVQIML